MNVKFILLASILFVAAVVSSEGRGAVPNFEEIENQFREDDDEPSELMASEDDIENRDTEDHVEGMKKKVRCRHQSYYYYYCTYSKYINNFAYIGSSDILRYSSVQSISTVIR